MASTSPEVLNLPYLFSCLLSVAAILIRYLSFSDSCVLVAVLGARRKSRICLSRCHTGRVPSFFYGPNMDLIPIPTPSSGYYGSATLLYHFDRMFTSRITQTISFLFVLNQNKFYRPFRTSFFREHPVEMIQYSGLQTDYPFLFMHKIPKIPSV